LVFAPLIYCGSGLLASSGRANQQENAVVNLVVNARDAMPEGDLIIIEPGQYVMLSASDTGSGIPLELIDEVFEPFFKTKQVDKGTGLGLAVVLGLIKQSGGHIRIYSEIGQERPLPCPHSIAEFAVRLV
jgi:signal transduction histidine kinase